ncbi:MAG: CooT family nickel-binding protein [Spirochaetes bacterium]|nr:CooT family nickel-binding protein [Spirochaetota bacterium]
MCMPSVWIKNNSGEEQIFAETATLRFDDNKIVLSTIFGDEKMIKAEIDKIDFVNSKIFLKQAN